MNPLDKWLEEHNLKYSDLSREEKDFYLNSQKQIERNPPSISEQVENLTDMIESILSELVEIRTKDDKDTFLKARVKDLIIIRNSLTATQKAKKQLERLLER